PPEGQLAYPVYTASAAVTALARRGDPALDAWLKYLVDRQLTEPLGWQPEDPSYGGWGYARALPRKPGPDEAAVPLAQPNFSATLVGLEALSAAGVEADSEVVQKALVFVSRCQNVAADDEASDTRFDDGGFFFIQGDPVRNKAGAVGVDHQGRERFAS